MKLDDFLAQIGQAGLTAARQARFAAAATLESELEPHPDRPGEFRFVRIPVRLPGPTLGEDNGPLVMLPRWGLLTGGNLDLGDMTATVEANIDISDDASAPTNGDGPAAKCLSLEMKKGMFKRSAEVKVEMKFQMGGSPEALEVLRYELVKRLNEQLAMVPPEPPDAAE